MNECIDGHTFLEGRSFCYYCGYEAMNTKTMYDLAWILKGREVQSNIGTGDRAALERMKRRLESRADLLKKGFTWEIRLMNESERSFIQFADEFFLLVTFGGDKQ